MTDNIPALITKARAFADRNNGMDWQGRIRELADALEAEHQRAEGVVREMHARELHHFEAERAMSEAIVACDKVLAVKVVRSTEADAAAAGVAAGLRYILTRALNEGEPND